MSEPVSSRPAYSSCPAGTEETASPRTAVIETAGIIQRENVSIDWLSPLINLHNLESLLGKIGEEVGQPITIADIEMCHRVPVPNCANKNIIVQFSFSE